MTDLDKMARELLCSNCDMDAEDHYDEMPVTAAEAESAIRAALLTAPPGHKLVKETKDNAVGAGDLEAALRALVELLQDTDLANTPEVAIAQEALERYDPSHTAALEKLLRDLNQEYERIYAALKQTQAVAPTRVHVMRNGELFWDISSPVFDMCGRLIAGHVTNGAWEVELDHQTGKGRVKGATDWFPIEDLSYVMIYPKEPQEAPNEDNIPF